MKERFRACAPEGARYAAEAPSGTVTEDETAARLEGRVLLRLSAVTAMADAFHRPDEITALTARRKASVVAAVLSGIITIEEVCQRYGLSVDEFLSWHNAMQRHG